MRRNNWGKELRVAIIGATGSQNSGGDFIKGFTTAVPPFDEGGVVKVEIIDDRGRLRKVAITRIKELIKND